MEQQGVDRTKYKFMIIADTKEERDKLIEFLDKNKAEYITPNPSQKKIVDNPDMLTCSDCKKTIPQNVAEYSLKWYGKHLCRDCQVEHKKKEESP